VHCSLTIGRVFVDHEWTTSLDLGLEDGIPQLLSLNCSLCSSLLLIPREERFEFGIVSLIETRCFRRTEQRPIPITLHSSHASQRVRFVERHDQKVARTTGQGSKGHRTSLERALPPCRGSCEDRGSRIHQHATARDR